MTHGYFTFKFSECFEDYANNDDYGRTHEYEVAEVGFGPENCKELRKNGNDTEEYSTDKGYSVENLLNISCCRSAGSITEDGTAIHLKVVGNFYGVEADGKVEVCERDDKNEVYKHANRAGHIEISEDTLAHIVGTVDKHINGRRKRNDGRSEDYGHNTAHHKLDGKMCVHAAIGLSAHSTLRILNGESSFSVVHNNNRCGDSQEQNDCDYENDKCVASAGDNIDNIESLSEAGDDVEEKDDGDTVADTAIVNLFTKPHDYAGAGNIASYDNEGCKNALIVKCAGSVAQSEIITGCCNQSESNCYISCYLGNLLLTVLFFRQSFKSGDSDCQKLHNDGRSNVRGDGQSEQSTFNKATAGHTAQPFKDGAVLTEVLENHITVYIGNGNNVAYTIQYNYKKCEDYLLTGVRYVPSVFKCLKHLISPVPSRQRLQFFPLLSQRKLLPLRSAF